jgi:hypothetical protein
MAQARQVPDVAPSAGARAKPVAGPMDAPTQKQIETTRDFATYRDALKYKGPLTGKECLAAGILMANAYWFDMEVDEPERGPGAKRQARQLRVEGCTIARLCKGFVPEDHPSRRPKTDPRNDPPDEGTEECEEKLSKMSWLRALAVLAHPDLPDGQRFVTRITKQSTKGVKNDVSVYILHPEAFDYWVGRPKLPESVRPPRKLRTPRGPFSVPWGIGGTCADTAAPGESGPGASGTKGRSGVNVSGIIRESSGTKLSVAGCGLGPSRVACPPPPKKPRRRPLGVPHPVPPDPALGTLAATHFGGDQTAAAAAVALYASQMPPAAPVPRAASAEVAGATAPAGPALAELADGVIEEQLEEAVGHAADAVDARALKRASAMMVDTETRDILRAYPPLAPLASIVVHDAKRGPRTAATLLGISARLHSRSIEEVQEALERLAFKLDRGDYPRLATLDPMAAAVELVKLARAFVKHQWGMSDCAPMPNILDQIPRLDPTPADLDDLCERFGVSREELAARRRRYDDQVEELLQIGAALRCCARALPRGGEAALVLAALARVIERWDPVGCPSVSAWAAERIHGAGPAHATVATRTTLQRVAARIEAGEHRAPERPREAPAQGLRAAAPGPVAPAAPARGPAAGASSRTPPSTAAQAVFDRAVAHMRVKVCPGGAFDQWFSGVQFDGLADGVLVLRAANDFVAAWVRDHFLSSLTDKLNEILGAPVHVAWTVDPQLDAPIAGGPQGSRPPRPRT